MGIDCRQDIHIAIVMDLPFTCLHGKKTASMLTTRVHQLGIKKIAREFIWLEHPIMLRRKKIIRQLKRKSIANLKVYSITQTPCICRHSSLESVSKASCIESAVIDHEDHLPAGRSVRIIRPVVFSQSIKGFRENMRNLNSSFVLYFHYTIS